MPDPEQPTIREIQPQDAACAARLSDELGYPATADTMEQRIRHLAGLANHAVFVACLPAGDVVGWIDVGICVHLQSEPYGEIGGLVVASEARSRGIGHLLIERAEEWVRRQGVGTMLVRSRASRERAHKFYTGLSYIRIKTSEVFLKVLP